MGFMSQQENSMIHYYKEARDALQTVLLHPRN